MPRGANGRGKVSRLMKTLHETAARHPSWPMRRLTESKLTYPEQEAVIVLIGKELGFERPDSDLFTGEGLAGCVSDSVPEVRHSLRLLVRKSSLRSGNYIRVCGGASDAGAVEDEATLRTCEFELSLQFRERLRIKKQRR